MPRHLNRGNATRVTIISATANLPFPAPGRWSSAGVCMSRRLRAAKWLIVVTALAGAWARPAQAQNTGVIEGTVVDEQGGVMPGVTITLRNTETGVERAVTTEGAGSYRFPALQPGTYSLTATLPGFASAQLRDIVLTIGRNLRCGVTLKLRTLAETVSVC